MNLVIIISGAISCVGIICRMVHPKMQGDYKNMLYRLSKMKMHWGRAHTHSILIDVSPHTVAVHAESLSDEDPFIKSKSIVLMFDIHYSQDNYHVEDSHNTTTNQYTNTYDSHVEIHHSSFTEAALKEVLKPHADAESAEAADTVPELSLTDRMVKAILMLEQQHVIKKLSDYFWLFEIHGEVEALPTFKSAKDFIEFLDTVGLESIPSTSTLQKLYNTVDRKSAFPHWVYLEEVSFSEQKRRQLLVQKYLNMVLK